MCVYTNKKPQIQKNYLHKCAFLRACLPLEHKVKVHFYHCLLFYFIIILCTFRLLNIIMLNLFVFYTETLITLLLVLKSILFLIFNIIMGVKKKQKRKT